MTTSPYATDDARWQAVQQRNADADGHFVYAVLSSGCYAQPSAGGRRPRRDNVVFFDTAAEAEAAGYRARHHPDHSAAIAAACRALDHAEPPSVTQLAHAAGLSEAQFLRQFRAHTGLTPRAYSAVSRAQRLQHSLSTPHARTIDALAEAGFSASGHVYQHAGAWLGMPVGSYRRGGHGQQIRFAVADCPLGALLVAATERGLCALYLGDDAGELVRALEDQFPDAALHGDDQQFASTFATLIGWLEDPRRALALPLDLQGTAFQKRVWQALQQIPLGTTVSYSELAAQLGQPSATRAVARACATNKVALAVPCHRVVRQDGSLSGYRWGIERKRELLQREAAATDED